MRYEIGRHSDDEQHCHVALIDDKGVRDELFDVTLYDPEVIQDDGRTALAASWDALTLLVERANAALGDPDPLGEPPAELADAWARYQQGEGVQPYELRALDEWRSEQGEAAGF